MLKRHDRQPQSLKQHFGEMLNAIRDSRSDLAPSEDEDDEEDKDDDQEVTELGKLSEDDERGWVMGTISKTVKHCMESCREMLMRLDGLMEPGWGDTADYFCETAMKYRMT